MARQPLRNAVLQNDLDGASHYILNVAGIGDSRANTAIIDPVNGNDSTAYVNGGIPFKTLAATLAAISVDQHNKQPARTPYVVDMRPGDYVFDGVQEIANGGVILRGYGARLIAETATNEQTKLLVSGASVVLEGLELDGQVDLAMLPVGFDSTDAAAGAIQVNGGSSLTIRNCFIHHWAAAAIYGVDGYRGLQIRDCIIENCQNATFLVTSGQDVIGVDFVDNEVSEHRHNGLLVKGSANSATRKGIANIHVVGNSFSNNVDAAMNLRDYVRDVFLLDNYVFGCGDGIVLHHCLRGKIVDNQIVNTAAPVLIDGCQIVKTAVNTIDGRNSAGTPVAEIGISLQGFYVAAGDTGPFNISGNIALGFGGTRRAIYCVGQNNILITGNRMTGSVFLQDVVQAQVKNNTIEVLTDLALVLVQSSTLNCLGVVISGNRFIIPTGTFHSVIKTSNLTGFNVHALHIIANSTPTEKTYVDGTIDHAADPPSFQYVVANTPPSLDATTGWVNDEPVEVPPTPQVFTKTVFVSQAFGDDGTGERESWELPFLTINAAITAATSGDTVVVADGVFNELLAAKNGIIVRFEDAASLVCSSAGGCIETTATNQAFTVYHEHKPIVCSEASVSAIFTQHAGAYIALHASVHHTGAAPFARGLDGSNGTIELWGYVKCETGIAIASVAGGGNFPFFLVHGGLSGNYDVVSADQAAIDIVSGSLTIINGTIAGGTVGTIVNAALCRHIYKRCSIYGEGANEAVLIGTQGSELPIFRDCILKSGSSATKTINSASAQDILLYGQTIGNKGANPPANITIKGGGTYAVSADLFAD